MNIVYSASYRVALTVTLNTRQGSAAGGTINNLLVAHTSVTDVRMLEVSQQLYLTECATMLTMGASNSCNHARDRVSLITSSWMRI
jgi:hypothetical protein